MFRIADRFFSIEELTMQRDSDCRVAKTPDEFRAAWSWHIGQLQLLALKADVTFEDWSEVRRRLDSWLNDAVAKAELERLE